MECTGQTITPRRTTTVQLGPLGLKWNSYIVNVVMVLVKVTAVAEAIENVCCSYGRHCVMCV